MDKGSFGERFLFNAGFLEVIHLLDGLYEMDILDDRGLIAIFDADTRICPHNDCDVILFYKDKDDQPAVVTERVYRNKKSLSEWRKFKKHMLAKKHSVVQELGYNFRVDYRGHFIDLIHYREDWWQWAKSHIKEAGLEQH